MLKLKKLQLQLQTFITRLVAAILSIVTNIISRCIFAGPEFQTCFTLFLFFVDAALTINPQCPLLFLDACCRKLCAKYYIWSSVATFLSRAIIVVYISVLRRTILPLIFSSLCQQLTHCITWPVHLTWLLHMPVTILPTETYVATSWLVFRLRSVNWRLWSNCK